MSGWISVKERLPDDRHRVLVEVTDGIDSWTEIATKRDHGWKFDDAAFGLPRTITHWMPLPPHPESTP